MSTILGWYGDGGPVTVLICVAACAGFAILLERLYVIVYRSKNNGRVFIERIIQLVRGGKIDEAIKQCVAVNAILPDMGLLILRSRSRAEIDLQNVADVASLAVVPRLTRRMQYLPMLATIAVLLGILGVVNGLHDVLLAAANAPDRGIAITHGFAGALGPLALGLSVAIILVVGRGYLESQAEALTDDVREFSARLINALVDRPDVRLGHR